MSSRGDTYADETFLEEDVRDRRDERPYEDEDDESWRFPYLPSWGWGGAWGVVPPVFRRPEEADPEYEGRESDGRGYDPDGETEVDEGGGIGRLRDEGLVTLLVVAGAVLFLFPEPATSGIGVLLMAVGVVAWLVDWAA